jgi:hypothetical protein
VGLKQWLSDVLHYLTYSCQATARKTRSRGINTRNNRNVGRVVFYAVRVVSKESLCFCMCIPLLLLGKHVLPAMNTHATIEYGVT